MSTVVLYQYPPVGALPSLSPFCWKAQMALRLRGVAFRVENVIVPRRVNPRGKVPYLTWNGEGIEDSTAIVRAIDARTDGPPLVPADPARAALAHVLEDWADESLYWYGVYAKFLDPGGWARVGPAIADAVPRPLRAVAPGLARVAMGRALAAQGLTRRAATLVDEEFARHVGAVDALLDGREYLAGDAVSIADLGVAPMLGQLAVGLTPRFGAVVARHPRVTAWLSRVRSATGC